MNRFLAIFAIFLIGNCITTSSAQVNSAIDNDTTQCVTKHRFYMEIQGVQGQLNANAYEIKFVAGKMFHDMSKTKQADLNTLKTNYEFRTLPDALNYMSLYGWQLNQTYVTALNGSICTHWVICKDVEKVEELADGITFEK